MPSTRIVGNALPIYVIGGSADGSSVGVNTVETAGSEIITGQYTATGIVEAISASVDTVKSILLRSDSGNAADFLIYDTTTGTTVGGYIELGEAIEIPVSPPSAIMVQGTVPDVLYWMGVKP